MVRWVPDPNAATAEYQSDGPERHFERRLRHRRRTMRHLECATVAAFFPCGTCPNCPHSRKSGDKSPHSKCKGFTLLEVMLALALSVVLLGLLGTAIQVHLTAADSSRTGVAEARAARIAVLRIADDIRNISPIPPSSSGATALRQTTPRPTTLDEHHPDRQPTQSTTDSQGAVSDMQTVVMQGGIYGDSETLLVNITRMPLLSFSQAASPAGDSPFATGQPADVRTVTYRVIKPEEAVVSPSGLPRCGRGSEWERSAYAWACSKGRPPTQTPPPR